ncbi:MAG TPA: hypothetical protein ENL10_00315 [Candidatus Cloacimonetes bacterium]|nr:LPP20 family lipoprotein [Candidatus Cloacimonadota bacterium]HHE39930.1 hypothetical protein [Candidatus Cloacimonadota bacterium]
MKKFILGLLAVLLILSCASSQKSINAPTQTKYPKWFITPQNAVIGYGPVYYIKESGAREATKSAVDNFVKLSHCYVLGTQTYIQSIKGLDLVYDSLFIHVEDSPADEKTLQKYFAHADTFATKDMIIVIYSRSSLDALKELLLFTENCQWVDTPPQDEEYVYAIGSCSQIFNEHKAWYSAENNAILNLARKISMNNAVEVLVNDNKLMSKFNENVNVELNNIEVVERWKDPKTNVYYVLIRM